MCIRESPLCVPLKPKHCMWLSVVTTMICTSNRRTAADDGGAGGIGVWVHVSLLPRPRRLALHLSSINHRERLHSCFVAIVSGPETVSGCLAAKRKSKKKQRKGKVEKKKGDVTVTEWSSDCNFEHLKQLREGKKGVKTREWHLACPYDMSASDSRSKMDSIFISAVNPRSPPVGASRQFHFLSQPKLSLSLSVSLKNTAEYFHSRHHLVNSTLTGLVHLGVSQYIELLLFYLTWRWRRFPLSWDGRWAGASCFIVGCILITNRAEALLLLLFSYSVMDYR